MIVVSGNPRSGTSLMMNIMRHGLGEDRIIGKEKPNAVKEEDIGNNVGKFLKKAHIDQKFDLEEEEHPNPNGFWEYFFTVKGLHYSTVKREYETIQKIVNAEKEYVGKIVSQGLTRTDPVYVSKIIYMLRDPRQVRKSMQRLNKNENAKNFPDMFIDNAAKAATWLSINNEIPILFVNYDDVIYDTKNTLNKIKVFLDEPFDVDNALPCVNQKLNRSRPVEDYELEDEMLKIYRLIGEKKYDEVLEIRDKVFREFVPEEFMCVRKMEKTTIEGCKNCKSNMEEVHKNRYRSLVTKTLWKKLPCVYECQYAENKITVEESIKNNFWDDGKDDQEIIEIFMANANAEKLTIDHIKGKEKIFACIFPEADEEIMNGEYELAVTKIRPLYKDRYELIKRL
jgi:hypothetical protein